jgi:hypothetical protein
LVLRHLRTTEESTIAGDILHNFTIITFKKKVIYIQGNVTAGHKFSARRRRRNPALEVVRW